MSRIDVTPYGLQAQIDKLKRALCCSTAVLAQYTDAQRDALTPYEGQIIYNTTTQKLNFFNGTDWEEVDSTIIVTTTTTTSTSTTTTTTV